MIIQYTLEKHNNTHSSNDSHHAAQLNTSNHNQYHDTMNIYNQTTNGTPILIHHIDVNPQESAALLSNMTISHFAHDLSHFEDPLVFPETKDLPKDHIDQVHLKHVDEFNQTVYSELNNHNTSTHSGANNFNNTDFIAEHQIKDDNSSANTTANTNTDSQSLVNHTEITNFTTALGNDTTRSADLVKNDTTLTADTNVTHDPNHQHHGHENNSIAKDSHNATNQHHTAGPHHNHTAEENHTHSNAAHLNATIINDPSHDPNHQHHGHENNDTNIDTHNATNPHHTAGPHHQHDSSHIHDEAAHIIGGNPTLSQKNEEVTVALNIGTAQK